VQYSFFVVKSASDQSVGGEKSPSEDGLKVSTATKIFSRFSRHNGVGRLCSPQSHRYLCAWGCMRGILPLTKGSLRLYKFVSDEFVAQLPPCCDKKSTEYLFLTSIS
jgi:hypothetical protein